MIERALLTPALDQIRLKQAQPRVSSYKEAELLDHNSPAPLVIVALVILTLILVGCTSSVPRAEAPTSSERPVALASSSASTAPTSEAATQSAVNDTAAPIIVTPTPDNWNYEEMLRLFDYDQQAPLDLQEKSSKESAGVMVHDISYASPKGGRVTGYLLVPPGSGPFAGVIMQHGLPGSRDSMRSYAEEIAKSGAVALLIDAPFARRQNGQPARGFITFTEQDRDEQIQYMIDLRRGVDVLSSRDDVDPNRIGYIGYSYGAAMGGLLAGIEKRIKAYVLMAGDGGLVEHYEIPTAGNDISGEVSEAKFERWKTAMRPIEPIRFVAHAAPSALLYQNARSDGMVSQEAARRYHEAGSEPKEIKWYNTGHGLNSQAFRDQVEFLHTYIGIDPQKFKW
ncbi:MAG TPA: alpha/beta fold hydrolase [Herpetosiphonaceae bacterium]